MSAASFFRFFFLLFNLIPESIQLSFPVTREPSIALVLEEPPLRSLSSASSTRCFGEGSRFPKHLAAHYTSAAPFLPSEPGLSTFFHRSSMSLPGNYRNSLYLRPSPFHSPSPSDAGLARSPFFPRPSCIEQSPCWILRRVPDGDALLPRERRSRRRLRVPPRRTTRLMSSRKKRRESFPSLCGTRARTGKFISPPSADFVRVTSRLSYYRLHVRVPTIRVIE